MNELFRAEKNYEMDIPAAEKCADDLIAFAQSVSNIVIVSDYIYSDAARYDESTEVYCKCLANIDRRLSAISDTVIEANAGNFTVHKGVMPQ